MAITVAMQQTVAAMYAALFNRAPEKAGLDFWCGQLDSGVSLAAMAQTMYETAPARATYPDGISNADVVKAFYLNVLGRAGDAEGLAFWEARLNTLGTKGALIAEMVANVQSYTGTDPAGVTSKALFDNKVTVGFAYAVTLGKEDVELAKSVLALVTATDTSAALNAANVGQTFTLTNSATADTLIGTSANDTFSGASGTVANGDALIDQSTTDNDVANLVVTAAYTPANIRNVEKVNLSWNAFGAASYDVGSVVGAKEINLTSSKVGFLGSATVANAKGNTINAGDGMVGTLTVTGGTSAGVTVNAGKASAVVVNAPAGTGAKATVNAGDATAAVTVAGFVNATVNSGKATTVSVTDAGNITDTTSLTLNANATVTNATTGALTLNAADTNKVALTNVIGSSMTVAGEGNVELTFNAANALEAKTLTNSKTSGTLTVKTGDTDGENIAKVQASLVEFTGAQAGTTVVANGANLKYSGANGAINISVTGDGTADAVSALVTKDQTSVTVGTGTETLNLAVDAATKVSGTDLTIGTLAVGTGTAKISGSIDLALGTITAGANGAVDATALAGDLVAATAATVSVSGGTGKLTLTSTGAATDLVAIGQESDDTVTASATTGTVNAILGNGKNTVTAAAVTTGTVVVTTGSGDDTVAIGGAAGAGTITSGVVNLNLGDGKNTVTVRDGAAATSKVTIVTGAGDDTITFGGSTAATGVLSITAGDGADTLVLDNATDLSLGTVSLTGIETIVINDAANVNNAKFQAATLSGKTIAITADGPAAVAGAGFSVVSKATTTAIDLSTLAIDQTITKAISAISVTAAAAAQAVAITGTAVADTIVGSDFADTIIAGNGQDNITGGKGNDSITLTETTANSVADTVVFSTVADNGQDTIIGFKSGTDKLALADADTTVATASGAAAVVAADVGGALTAGAANFGLAALVATTTSDVVELALTLNSAGNLANAINGTELLKALSATTTAATGITVDANADAFYLVAYQNGNAYMYQVADANSDSVLAATEITLVGTLNGVAAGTLVAADFVIA